MKKTIIIISIFLVILIFGFLGFSYNEKMSKVNNDNQIVKFSKYILTEDDSIAQVPTCYTVDFSNKQVEKLSPESGGSKKIYTISKTELENIKLSMSKCLFNTRNTLKQDEVR